jgi:tetratricopeptide (TPR) repeat protein
MSDKSTKIEELLADARLAFMNGQNEKALEISNKAINLAPNNADAYQCAANAYMSLERYDSAIAQYTEAVKYDSDNGNRYFNLGYALATVEKLADALKNLAKADELGCTPDNTIQLYTILGIICFDIGRYDDAIVNFGKVEQLVGIDIEIMQRKAIIYGIKNEIKKGLQVANGIKLIAPSEYLGYQLAFNLLCQANRFDEAGKELTKAKKWTNVSLDYFSDCVSLELQLYTKDKDEKHFHSALSLLDTTLKTFKPTVNQVFDCYINSAEIYLQLENPEKTIECINAAQNPVDSFNLGFEIITPDYSHKELTDYDIEVMIESDKAEIEEKFGDYGLAELAESIEPDEFGNRDYFTDTTDSVTDTEEDKSYKLDNSEKLDLTQDEKDRINRLFIGAYTLQKDFSGVVKYSEILQSSTNIQSQYIGKYSETNALKELNSPDYRLKYEELIKYFKKQMIIDATDILAVTFRIQCYIDIGLYEDAQHMCNLLSPEIKEPLLNKVNEAKLGGD